MGLDVMVYKNVTKSTNIDEESFEIYVINPDWDHKVKNFESGVMYMGDLCDSSISYSYGSHNRFRENILKLVGREDLLDTDGRINWEKLENNKNVPFHDLLDFADNEGCLDWETSESIFKDFEKWKHKAESSEIPYFYDTYARWLNIFEEGKEVNSVVMFC